MHDLRRSFVTLARRSGLPESVVARFSGHRTPAVFKRYNIVEEQDLKAAVEVLNLCLAKTRSPDLTRTWLRVALSPFHVFFSARSTPLAPIRPEVAPGSGP